MVVKVFVCFMTMCVAMTYGWAETCTDNLGGSRDIGANWDDGFKECGCYNPDSFLAYWDGYSQSGDAVVDCKFKSCPSNAEQTAAVGDGETINYGQFTSYDECTCKEGSNPQIMDTYTLVYVDCTANGVHTYFDFDH